MAAIYPIRKDNYVFEFLNFYGAPLPVARIDEEGNEIPMEVTEIKEWRDNYYKTHPEAAEEYRKMKEEEKREEEEALKVLEERKRELNGGMIILS